MTVELVTGYSGTAHVSSSEDGARQAGTVGTGMYVLETVDDPLAATLENAQTVTVGPGDLMINGRHVQLTGSTTYSVPVGVQGQQTSNILAVRYSVDDSGAEKAEPVTLTGSPAPSDPPDPTLYEGSILDGDSPVDMPLYRVVTTGIETAEPVALFETVPTVAKLSSPGGITGEMIAADSVTADKIAAGAVGTSEIKDDAVTAAKIATNAVTADGIAAGAVGSSELASNAVQTAKIAANAVTSDKLAQSVRDSISHPTLWTGTVTTGGSVTVSGIASWLMVGLVVSLSVSSTTQTTVIPCTVLNGYLSGASGIALEDPNTGARILAVVGRVSGTKMTINVASMTDCVASENAVTLPTNSMRIFKVIGLVHA